MHTRLLVVAIVAIGCSSHRSPTPAAPATEEASLGSEIAPYANQGTNVLYNLLFCDDRSAFSAMADSPGLAPIFADPPDPDAIRALASDPSVEARMRVLAFRRLQEAGEPVPEGQLLGTIVEVRMDDGLDTLAAFVDGEVRYLNHGGSVVAVMEDAAPEELNAAAQRLLEASAALVPQIGPWTEPRLPPPDQSGEVRLSFLVSDGLYFGQGPYSALASDAKGGPVLAAATDLLQAVTRNAAR